MVFERGLKSAKKKPNVRCKSADSGVSVALSKISKRHNVQSSNNEIYDFEEEHLDFEPEIGDGFDGNSQNQSLLESQVHIYSDQSTVKDFNLCSQEDIDSDYSATIDNCSISNISIAHRKDMLPVPHSDAKDGRQNQYLPICYTPASGRTTIDSSSEDDSLDSNIEGNTDIIHDHTRDQYSGQLGHENGENSSPYSMTQEEEDRLLDSEEEEPQESNFLIQPGFVETCQIGNARITLPKFVSSFPKEQLTNDLKRNKTTAKLKTLECRKKKKKWDLAFKPEHKITQVFLNDIGYIAVNEEDNEESENNSSLSEPSFRSILVICNKDKEKPQGSSQREIISLSKNDANSFKLPLPPPKRPPTRPKRTVSNSDGSGQNLQIKFSNKEDDLTPRTQTFIAPKDLDLSESSQGNSNIVLDKDDAISIMASTIGGDNVDDIANLDQLEKFETFSSDQPTINCFENDANQRFVEDRVKQWVQNVPNPEIFKTLPNLLDFKPIPSQQISFNPTPQQQIPFNPTPQQQIPFNQTPQQQIPFNPSPPQQIAKGMMPPVSAKGNPRINFREIPNVFAGLCYHYYFSANCTKPNCSLAHSIFKEKFISRFQRVDPKELFKHFQFAIRFEKLFEDIYPSFLSTFGRLKMQNELITCIKYFLEMKKIDSTDAIALVIQALEVSGLFFQDAIEMISFNIGFLEHPLLADILLDLITRTYDISQNWGVIKRISKARGKIKPSIVSRILSRMLNVYPPNKELCVEIYNVLIKNNMTDLSQINESVLIPYRTLINSKVNSTAPATITTVPESQIQPIKPITVTNPQELLAAHIDNNLTKERERYEREVEGTTVKTRVGCELNYPPKSYNYESPQIASSENRSHSSGSDERYFRPTPRISPFPLRDHPSPDVPVNNQYSRNNVFSRATPSILNSSYESEVDLNTALRFEPPSEISEYVPQNVGANKRRSENQEDEVNLTPSRPIFGKACYRNDFNSEKSLHNLLPDSFEHVNINERDVAKLNSVIKSKNSSEFYELLEYYKSPATLQNFITMTIANLKLSVSGLYDTLKGILQSFESKKPDYCKDREIKAIIEVIVMNSLFELEKKGLWTLASNLLQLYCDWDSLVSSKLFQIFSKRRFTHMGRYIFIAKLLSKAKNFALTFEILQSPELNLLGPPETWPYFYSVPTDLESRNVVLKEFFNNAHHYYIVGVSYMYRKIYKYGGIYGFDAGVHFNPMLIAIINEQQTQLLKHFYSDIDIYYKVMDKNVLRAFTILLAEQLSQESLFRLYEFCCERQIYTNFAGGETNIIVRNNMFDMELQLILNYYFYKLSRSRTLPPGDLSIQIRLMDNKPLYPKILQRCIRSIKEINNNVKKILKDRFSIDTSETPCEQFTVIQIQHEQLVKWLQCNQMWFPIYS